MANLPKEILLRQLNKENITEVVIQSFRHAKDDRFKQLLTQLIRHVHEFARETELTHAEWQAGLAFLTQAGNISDSQRNEFVLTSDVLGLSSLVDLLNYDAGATEGSVLGPFHSQSSPLVTSGSNLAGENEGERVLLKGRVLDLKECPIAGAMVDFWQTAANGLYPSQDPDQPPDNLRCRVNTDDRGRFALKVIRPAAYTVPYDGPVGDLLRTGGRHAWRPAHFHFIASAPGYCSVVTELFDEHDRYLNEDAAFGVRDSLVVRFQRDDSSENAASLGFSSPFSVVDFDFHLRPLTPPPKGGPS